MSFGKAIVQVLYGVLFLIMVVVMVGTSVLLVFLSAWWLLFIVPFWFFLFVFIYWKTWPAK